MWDSLNDVDLDNWDIPFDFSQQSDQDFTIGGFNETDDWINDILNTDLDTDANEVEAENDNLDEVSDAANAEDREQEQEQELDHDSIEVGIQSAASALPPHQQEDDFDDGLDDELSDPIFTSQTSKPANQATPQVTPAVEDQRAHTIEPALTDINIDSTVDMDTDEDASHSFAPSSALARAAVNKPPLFELDEAADTDAVLHDQQSTIANGLVSNTRPPAVTKKIESTPLNLDKPIAKSRRGSLLLLLLFVTIVGGSAWIFNHSETLARESRLRPLLLQWCPSLGCQLPPAQDIASIKTTKVVVREHPEEFGVILIDLTLTNLAAYAQPYPDVSVTFTGFNGDIVHVSNFTPHQYLLGELKGSEWMAVSQPIYLSLEMPQPVAEAVGYEIKPLANNR